VRRNKRLQHLFPAWNMPSDPVKALWWFMNWLLKVLVRFFWIPVLVMVVYETVSNWRVAGPFNGIVGGIITLLVGAFVWAVLYGLSFVVNIGSSVSRIMSDMNDLQQQSTIYRRPFSQGRTVGNEDNVVEGTITDLDEERQKRRREQR
jgi:uncharacterized membrane protein